MASPRRRLQFASLASVLALMVASAPGVSASSAPAPAAPAAVLQDATPAPSPVAPSATPTITTDPAQKPSIGGAVEVTTTVVPSAAVVAAPSPGALPNGSAPFCLPPVTAVAGNVAGSTSAAAAASAARAGARVSIQPMTAVASGITISGRVTTTGGLAIQNVAVIAIAYGYYSYDNTTAEGKYAIPVAVGDYQICFDTRYATASNGSTGYLSGYYKNLPPSNFIGSKDIATGISIDSTSVGGINVQLPVGRTIAGKVIGSGGAALSGIAVTTIGAYIGRGVSDVNGKYSVVVPAGSYTMRYLAGQTLYNSGYYNAAGMGHFTLHEDYATPVVVGAANVSNIDIQLELGRQISGRVTGAGNVALGGIHVKGVAASGYCLDSCEYWTDASGNYSITVVPDDTVTLAFTDDSGLYLNGYYRAAAIGNFTTDYATATPFLMSASKTNVFVQMQKNHFIRGTVRNLDGVSLGGVRVAALNTASAYCGRATTAADGTYAIDVPSGAYEIQFGGNCTGATGAVVGGVTYLDGWWASGRLVPVPYTISSPLTVAAADVSSVNTMMLQPWRVELYASATTVRTGKPVTLTASVNQNVALTPWNLEVVRNSDNSVRFGCGSGVACAGLESRLTNGSASYRAMVAFNDTSSEQGWSSALVVNWYQSTYHPVDPVRVFDSRNGTGLLGKLVAKTPRAIAVAGQLTLPSGISAITANVTVTGSTAGWAVYLGPSPNASPSSSMINFTAGQTVANGVTVALASTGKVYATYISNASNTTEIVIDVTGYFTANLTGETYTPIAPVRELDTRSNKGISGKLSPFAPQAFQVAGNDGIPLTAQAVTGIVTVANPSDGYAVFLGPTSIAHPTSSTINFGANQTISNNLTVKLGAGKIWATFLGSGTTDLVFDVTGYYVTSTAGSIYVPMEPVRLLDTRNGTGHSGKIVYGTPIEFAVGSNTGNGGIPMVSSAVTGNVTVVNQSFGWAVFLGPAKTMSPSTSTVNFVVDQVTANGCTVRLSPSASLWATFVSNGANTTDLVFDATGFFLP